MRLVRADNLRPAPCPPRQRPTHIPQQTLEHGLPPAPTTQSRRAPTTGWSSCRKARRGRPGNGRVGRRRAALVHYHHRSRSSSAGAARTCGDHRVVGRRGGNTGPRRLTQKTLLRTSAKLIASRSQETGPIKPGRAENGASATTQGRRRRKPRSRSCRRGRSTAGTRPSRRRGASRRPARRAGRRRAARGPFAVAAATRKRVRNPERGRSPRTSSARKVDDCPTFRFSQRGDGRKMLCRRNRRSTRSAPATTNVLKRVGATLDSPPPGCARGATACVLRRSDTGFRPPPAALFRFALGLGNYPTRSAAERASVPDTFFASSARRATAFPPFPLVLAPAAPRRSHRGRAPTGPHGSS